MYKRQLLESTDPDSSKDNFDKKREVKAISKAFFKMDV